MIVMAIQSAFLFWEEMVHYIGHIIYIHLRQMKSIREI